MTDREPHEEHSATDVAAALQRAFADLAAADLPPDEKGRWHQRLIAVTNAAKRDVARSQASLGRYEHDWAERLAAPADDDAAG